MTIKDAISILNMVEAHGVCVEAKDVAIESMKALREIKQIIDAQVYLQEDVWRYKAICEVVKELE